MNLKETGKSDIVMLPAVKKDSKFSIERAIVRRRSVRKFAPTPLNAFQISQILFAAQGITDPEKGLRAAPSAGATFPLELYCITAEGVFHYFPKPHALKRVKNSDIRSRLSDAALGQRCIREAPATIVITAVFSRTTARYGERGVRYIYMEAGHVAENIHLQAVALSIGSVPVGAFEGDKIHDLIGCTAEEKVLYCIPLGIPSEQ